MASLLGYWLPKLQSLRAADAKAPAADDPLAFHAEIAPLLAKHCTSCHGLKKQENGVNFATFSDVASILSRRELWTKARAALQSEEMPPDPEETHFTADDRRQLIHWIENRIEKIDRASPIYLDPGPPLVRQLTRDEYNHTVRDLLRIDFDPASAAGISEEQVADGFSNLAGSQLLTEPLLEKYFAAADETLEFFFNSDAARNGKLKSAREALFIARPSDKLSPHDAAAKVLQRFARRAFRRPVEQEELDRLLAIVDRSLKAGDDYELAVRKAMKPVLVSPYFLYRWETDQAPDGSTAAYRVSDHELAARLSYFLWATMPDDTLFALADAGKLSQPEVLGAQVKRMLADGKSRALTDYFAVEWLQLQRLGRALPSKDYFPALTGQLKNAMGQETRQFFDALRTDDHSVLDLLDADYTYVNEDLARFYGLSGVHGDQFRKVALKPQDHRGGLLGMSSILTMTSHTDRTKPTSRGKWILEVILGTPPAPPPANAGVLRPPKDMPDPQTFREKLALHARDATCAGCHKKIDPLGFALENYDAIGAWREQVAGAPVDNVGRLPGGQEFRGPAGLKQILSQHKDQFVRNLTVELQTYALGRKIEYYDEAAVAQIDERLAQNDYRFSTLIAEIVNSRPFAYRKNLRGE